MAFWCDNLINANKYKKVSLKEGLDYIRNNEGEKLFSVGLEEDEYIIFINDHYEFEDGCYIGKDDYEFIERVCGNHSTFDDLWIYKEWYIEVKNSNN